MKSAVLASPVDPAAEARKRMSVGTLHYTKAGLVWMFVWMLWGDFAFQLMEWVAPTIVPLRLKEELGTPDWLLPIIVASIPSTINFLLNPVISTMSDRHRGRMGRRIPFLLWSTPFIAAALVLMAFSPEIGVWLHRVLGPRTGWSAGWVAIGTLAVLWITFVFSNMFLSTVFYYFFNDVVPGAYMSRFFGFFRAIANLAAMLLNWFVFEHALSHFRWIFLGAAAIYAVSFPIVCLAIKEGKYPPAPPMAKGPLGMLGTYAKECLCHRFYIYMFLHNMAWGAASAVGLYTVFLQLSLGISKQQIGRLGAVVMLVNVLLQPAVGFLADRFHPMRLLVWIKIALVLIVPLNFVWLCGRFAPHTAYLILIVLSAIQLPLGLVYDTVLQPTQMRVWPKSRYGQFCSFQAILRALSGIVASSAVGICFMEPMRKVFPDKVWGKDYCYRMMPAWQLPFLLLALCLLLLMYREWKRLGGEKNYKVPGFDHEAVPAMAPAEKGG